jgi:HSP20 family protein
MTYLVPRSNFSLWDDWLDFDRLLPKKSEISGAKIAPLDIKTDEKNIYITTEIAGVDKKDINIEYKEGYLTISGEKKAEKKEEHKGYFYSERSKGKFARSIYVGEIDFDASKAEYKNGVLELVLPKKEESKEKTQRLQIN